MCQHKQQNSAAKTSCSVLCKSNRNTIKRRQTVILISHVKPQRSSHSPAVHKQLVCLCTTSRILICVCTPERTRHALQASLILAHLRGITCKTRCLLKRQSSLISAAAFLLWIVPAEGKKAGQSLWESSEACSDHKPLKQVFLPPETIVWSTIFQPISDNYRATCSHTRQSLMSLRDGTGYAAASLQELFVPLGSVSGKERKYRSSQDWCIYGIRVRRANRPYALDTQSY